MARSELYPLANRAVGGRLAELLARWREEDLSIREIQRRLADEHGIDVSHETVRRWLSEPDETEQVGA